MRASSPYLDAALTDGGVALVTTHWRGRTNAMTASFFAESSHVPMLIRVAIATTALTHDWVVETGRFGLSVLAQGQERAALVCGLESGRDTAKLERLRMRWRLGAHGAVILPDAFSSSECRVVERDELPDHTLFVAELKSSFRQSLQSFREPLLVSELLERISADRS